jgi:hypothetical protein
MQQIWAPTSRGDDITAVNNFKADYFRQNLYYNISSRGDYIISDKWKVFGRFSRFRTNLTDQNYTNTNNIVYQDINSGAMNSPTSQARSHTNPSTVIDIAATTSRSMMTSPAARRTSILPRSRVLEQCLVHALRERQPSLNRFFFPASTSTDRSSASRTGSTSTPKITSMPPRSPSSLAGII